jgi:hypothetical protein
MNLARDEMSKEAKKKLPFLKRMKRGAVLGTVGLAGLATATGAASAAKTEASRPLAPPTDMPPGY